MLFDRSLSIFSMTSLKQYMEYFHFRCKIQLDHPVNLEERLPVHLGDGVEHRSREDDLGNVVGYVGLDPKVGAFKFGDVDNPLDDV